MEFLRALKAAFQGVLTTLKTERNFKIHVTCAIIVVVLGFVMHINRYEWLWLSVSIVLVLAAELFNTALEALTDLVSPSYHELAKKVKDAAAAGVLMMAIFAIICGLIIFLPKLVL